MRFQLSTRLLHEGKISRQIAIACLLICLVPLVVFVQRETSKEKRQIWNAWPKGKRTTSGQNPTCSMSSCFDSSRCRQFKVYVYPTDPQAPPISENYHKILAAIRRSSVYTTNPNEACLFVPSLDTLDRDPLSARFIRDLDTRLANLSYWFVQPKHGGQSSGRFETSLLPQSNPFDWDTNQNVLS